MTYIDGPEDQPERELLAPEDEGIEFIASEVPPTALEKAQAEFDASLKIFKPKSPSEEVENLD